MEFEDLIIREDELADDIKEILRNTNRLLSVENISNQLKRKYKLRSESEFISGKKLRAIMMQIDGVEPVNTGSRFLRYTYRKKGD